MDAQKKPRVHSSAKQHPVRYYEALKQAISPGRVVRDLLPNRVTSQRGNRLELDCPHHASTSKTSLHVDTADGLWFCFGCQEGGDIIQFVEWVRSGQTFKGEGSGKNPHHVEARDWLADHAGFPRLSDQSLSMSEKAAIHANYEKRLRIEAALQAVTQSCKTALLNAPESLEWLEGKYGFDATVAEKHNIGLFPNNLSALRSALQEQKISDDDLIEAGVLVSNDHGLYAPFFGRILFPYTKFGMVVELSARKMDWQPNAKGKPQKFLRLTRRTRPDADSRGDGLFGEDSIRAKSDPIIFTEGIPDAIAAQEMGFAAVALGTHPPAAALGRIAGRIGSMATVWFVPDQEASLVGIRSSLKHAITLQGQGMDCRMVLLPPTDGHQRAKNTLDALLGPGGVDQLLKSGGWETKDLQSLNPDADPEQIRELIAASKTDLCEWRRCGGTTDELRTLGQTADDPIVHQIGMLPKPTKGSVDVRLVQPILKQIAALGPTAADQKIKDLKTATKIGLGALRCELKEIRKTLESEQAIATQRVRHSTPKGADQFHLTDAGNAKRLVHHFGANIRYCPERERWLVWDGTRWRPDTANRMLEIAKATAKRIESDGLGMAECSEQEDLLKSARKSESLRALKAMVEAASSDPLVHVSINQLDSHPNVINLQNGTLELKTLTLRPHDRADLITKIIPIPWDPEAKAPKWEKVLHEVLPSSAMRDFFQRAVGYSLSGEASEQVFILLHGTGANGKTTMMRVLLDLFGADYSIKTASELLVAKPTSGHSTDRADLAGVLLAYAAELPAGRALDVGLIKELTGSEVLRARPLYKDNIEFRPTHCLWASTNNLPKLTAPDLAFDRRLRVIEFEVQVAPEKQDCHLLEALQNEIKGILVWAVKGYQLWRGRGLRMNKQVKAATEALTAEPDVFSAFLESCAERTCNPTDLVQATLLYDAYSTWAMGTGLEPETQQVFGGAMTRLGVKRKSRKDANYYIGLQLIPVGGGGASSSFVNMNGKEKRNSK